MAGRQIHRLKTEVCIIQVNAGEDGGYHLRSTKSKWGRNTKKNSSFEVHNLMCFFGLPLHYAGSCSGQENPKWGVVRPDPEIKVVT